MLYRSGLRGVGALAACALSCGIVCGGPPALVAADAAVAQLIRLDPQTGAPTIIGPMGNQTVAALAWDSHRGILYATSTATNALLRIDPQTGASASIGSLGTGCCMHGLEYNPTNGIMYGLRTGSPQVLYRINLFTGAATQVATIVVPTGAGGALAWDSVNSVMYVSEISTQMLHRVNLSNGALTLIGPFNAPHPTSPFTQVGVAMAFHPALGLYTTDNGGLAEPNDLLYRVNTATGQATLVGPTNGSNMLGLAFLDEACYPDCNADNALTIADFGCFQTRFVSGLAYGDCNGDGSLTIADFGCFQTAFVSGCP
jgi:hypothetical protein